MSNDSSRVEFNEDQVAAVNVSLLGLFALAVLVFSAWFWSRRKRFPIGGRQPLFVLIVNLWILAYSAIQSSRLVFRYSCTLFFLLTTISLMLIIAAYMVRFARLMFRFELSIAQLIEEEQLDMLQTSSSNGQFSIPASRKASSPNLDVTESKEDLLSDRGRVRTRSVVTSALETLTVPDMLKTRFGDIASLQKEQGHKWFLRNRRLADLSVLLAIKFLIAAAFVIPGIAILAAFPVEDTNEPVCNTYIEWNVYIAGCGVVTAVFLSYMVLKIREVVDGYGIKEEFLKTAKATAVGALVWAVVASFKVTSSKVYPFQQLTTMLIFSYFLYRSTIYPLYCSYAVQESISDNAELLTHDTLTLEGVLFDTELRRMFREFLVNEFSLENLIFYEEVADFQAVALQMEMKALEALKTYGDQPDRVEETARRLYWRMARRFIELYSSCVSEQAPYIVNLSFQTRSQLEATAKVLIEALQAKHGPVAISSPGRTQRRLMTRRRGSSIDQRSNGSNSVYREPSRSASQQQQQHAFELEVLEIVRPRPSVTSRQEAESLSSEPNQPVVSLDTHEEGQILNSWRELTHDFAQTNLDHTVFNTAQESIYFLLKRDCFMRFRVTPAYRQHISKRVDKKLAATLERHFSNADALDKV